MFSINIKTNFGDINLENPINKSLIQATQLVQGKAKVNAPFMTGQLRQSITSEIHTNYWIVWSNKVYARRREFENKKNPDRKFYMYRALKSSKTEIKQIFLENLRNSK